MIYMAIECTKCGVTDRCNTHVSKTLFTRWMREKGWRIGRDGTTICPNCKKTHNNFTQEGE